MSLKWEEVLKMSNEDLEKSKQILESLKTKYNMVSECNDE